MRRTLELAHGQRWGVVVQAMLVTLIFAGASFWGALLLFLIQPMIGKAVLPLLGGSPQVWITCLLFFQAVVLVGYLYAHLLITRLPRGAQAGVHGAIAALSLLALPIGFAPNLAPPAIANPAPWLLMALAMSIGIPAFFVASTAPLLQRWYSRAGVTDSNDPYFLYAASNLGSLIALLAYPVAVEPLLDLGAQRGLWSGAYIGLIGLHALCIVLGGRGAAANPGPRPSATVAPPRAMSAVWRERLMWLALAFIPSSLLLGVTTYITSDLISSPLLWIVPLVLYLLTFIIAFARTTLVSRKWVASLQAIMLAALAFVTLWPGLADFFPTLAAHLFVFFLTALVCHGELAARRPAPERLTEYYLFLSLGGVLGGAFNALLAPVLFNDVYEYPLLLALACLVRPGFWTGRPRERVLDIAVPALIAFCLLSAPEIARALERIAGLAAPTGNKLVIGVIASLAALSLITFALRPLRLTLMMAVVMAFGLYSLGEARGRLLLTERSFFGVLRVERHSHLDILYLVHGDTTHGAQVHTPPEMRREPITYYVRSGPFGDLFRALSPAQLGRPVAVVGLGVGSLGCYGQRGQDWTFYEIDPLVERLANNEKFFTFMRDCPPEKRVVLGDARLSLRAAADGTYGLIFMDAFASDAIPVHLMTREALALYLAKLTPDGLIVFNISHRVMDLAPIIGRLAADAGVVARIVRHRQLRGEFEQTYGYTVDIAVLTRDPANLGALANDPRWELLPIRREDRVWTDDYSNPLSAIKLF